MLSHQFALSTAEQSCAQPQSRTFPPPVSCPLILQLSVCLHISAGCVSFLRKYKYYFLKRTNCFLFQLLHWAFVWWWTKALLFFQPFFFFFFPPVWPYLHSKSDRAAWREEGCGCEAECQGWMVESGWWGVCHDVPAAAAFHLWLVRMTHEIQFNRWKMRMPPTSSCRPAQQGVPPART